jgi:hypothetical protein
MAIKVACPHCGKDVPADLFYSALGKVRSEKKAKASARNGTFGGGQPDNQNWKGRLKSGSPKSQT